MAALPGSRRTSRIERPMLVPPGSWVTTTSPPSASPSRRHCVLFPLPSIPSRTMNGIFRRILPAARRMPRAPVAAILLAVANALAEGGCLPPPESARAVEAADAFTAGVQLVAAERWTDAERAFLDALALDPGMPLAYYGVGQARMALKRHADAAAAFEQSHEAVV